ncbi:hypothetical protein LCGC14_1148170 [marine sediment metagenome]|uniref:Uncharacterized protein n=1 Tax=marine sediment metagenome TaxID=412755 RepID=A0A0F9M1A4_9ZZZZ
MKNKRTWINNDDPTLGSTIFGVISLVGIVAFFVWLGIT